MLDISKQTVCLESIIYPIPLFCLQEWYTVFILFVNTQLQQFEIRIM
jgi:hypothetical protein